MNALRKEDDSYRMNSPWWQLAENLNGRIARHICLVDDRGELAYELEARGVSVDRKADYLALRPSVTEDDLQGALMELDPRKVKALLLQCTTELVLVVGEPEQRTVTEQDGVAVSNQKRRNILAVLDGLNVNYSYKTILSGDVGCFVVEGLA